MKNKYNKLINLNLNFLGEKEGHSEYHTNFLNEDGRKIESWDMQTETLAELMLDKGLIFRDNERCDLSLKGLEIHEKGGWLKYLEQIEDSKILEKEKKLKQDVLQQEINNLTYENLKYQKSKREQTEKITKLNINNLEYQETIRELKEELMISSLLRNYWYLIGVAITVGVAIGGYFF